MNNSVFISCLIYLTTFGISCLLIHLYERNQNKVFLIIGLLLPCILAGVRAEVIGTDVTVYVKPMYEAAVSSSNIVEYRSCLLPYAWSYKGINEYEIGFTTVVYVISKLFGNLQILLGLIQMMVIIPLFQGLREYKKCEKSFSLAWGMLTFYMFFFNTSLNLMRQWIAIAILIYGFNYALKKNNIKYLMCVFVASLFHISALVGIVILPIYYLTSSNGKIAKIRLKLGKVRCSSNAANALFIVIGIICCVLMIDVLSGILGSLGLGKFSSYLGSGFTFSMNQLILKAPVLVIVAVKWNRLKQDRQALFWLVLLLIDTVLSQMIAGSTYAYRVTMYFMAYSVYIYPTVFLEKRKPWVGKAMLLGFLLLFWLYMFVYKGSDETIPYHFFTWQRMK